MALEIWHPINGFRATDSLFNRMWRTRPAWDYGTVKARHWGIPVDVVRDEDDVLVTAALPGVAPDDLKVVIEDGVLTIEAEAREESGENKDRYHLVRERRTGAFRRALRLPEDVDVDRAESSYEHGVLRVRLPKQEGAKSKQLQVEVK